MDLEKELKQVFEVRNKLLACQDIRQVSRTGLEIIRNKLRAQTASIFLFSREGFLERFHIIGKDKNGDEITDDWFKGERYMEGASFTGKVLVAPPNSKFGQPVRTVDMDKDEIDEFSRVTYKEKLGLLKSAIVVPLNGVNKTYGAVEVINKVRGDREVPREEDEHAFFTQEDMYWLSLIGMNLATAITNLRRRTESDTLHEISSILVEPIAPELDPRPIYQAMIDKLIHPLSLYKVCILRIGRDSDADTIEVVAKAGQEDTNWEKYVDEPLRKGELPPGEVFATGEPIFVKDIREEREKFRNLGWIEANRLRSFACFPLKITDEVVGTMSLFMGFPYTFFEYDIGYLNNITYLIGAFTRNLKTVRDIASMHDSIAEAKLNLASAGRDVAFDRKIEDVMHEYVNELLYLQRALQSVMESPAADRNRILQEKIGWIQSRVGSLKKEFEQSNQETLNINHVIREVLKIYAPEQKKGLINFNADLDPQVPSIWAAKKEMRAIVYNPISNAVKAIRQANRRRGEVNITTSVISEEGISYIQFTIEDNGVGIKKEDYDRIYQRGMSTYADGTGMGLYILDNVVASYGGKIDLISFYGKWTKFLIKIPIRRNQPRK